MPHPRRASALAGHALLGAALLLTACGDTATEPDGSSPPESQPPQIFGVTPSLLAPGAIATITGANFSATAAGNIVTVGNVPAQVSAASATQLTVKVADPTSYPCAPTGNVPVAVTVGGVRAETGHPLQVAHKRQLAPGATLRLGAGEDCNELVGGGGYVVSVLNATLDGTSHAAFRLVGQGATNATAAVAGALSQRSVVSAAGGASRLSPEALERIQKHDRVLRWNEESFQRRGRRSGRTGSAMPALTSGSLPQVGDVITGRMPNPFGATHADQCETQPVEARVVYVGQHAIVLEDVSSPFARQLDQELASLGAEYDRDMYPVLLANFGDPAVWDVDNDGRVYMLFTPRVNALGVAGYVTPTDFYSPVESGCAASNQVEIFYGEVPHDGSDVDRWRQRTGALVIHEVKHIAGYAAREVMGASSYEDRWLEESTAMLAEELWARQHYGYGQGTNTTYGESLVCELQPGACGSLPYVMSAHFDELAAFMANSEVESPLTHGEDGYESYYGSGWSLVRWAADHHGGSEGAFLRALTQSTDNGMANLAARAGMGAEDMLRNWNIAVYLDDYPGFTPADPRVTMPSWNLDDIFAGLHTDRPGDHPSFYPLQPRMAPAGTFDQSVGALAGGAAATFELAAPASGTQTLSLRGSGGGAAPSSLRMSIVRVY